ncbi:MAG: DEAD/DEAH box helicase [Muribaculaceae bacterium]|nr:DEAD/DEAH box helicase [Muribaculaceae bacterium]
MNFADFYESARNMLIDYITSIWFRGKPAEQAYVRSLLSEDEPLIAEPVFQSIFPWEESKDNFEQHSSKLNILSKSFVDVLSSNDVKEDFRFPKDRHPYKHQTLSWKTMLSRQNKTIVVTSGTGSGKTECFMIPVLQDIAARNERDCVQAIFLYPLNALMKSQQQRMDAWCNAIPGKITYAIYNGDTEKDDRNKKFTDQYFPQLITRPQIRRTPPQILFTNPTMLNYMLVRAEDKPILEKSRGKLKWILLDEAHTYTGSSAAELSLQLRRVLDAFGVSIEQVNFAVTSATIGDENDPKTELKLKKFVSQLTGKNIDNIIVIGGKRIIPEIESEKAELAIDAINRKYGINATLKDIEKLRNRLNTTPVLKAREIVKFIDSKSSKNLIKSLQIIDELGNKIDGLNINGTVGALLPSRAHFFIRSISGLYACVNPECQRHQYRNLSIGNLTTYQNANCPVCKSRMLEVTTCPSCGDIILVGENSTSKGYRMHVNTYDLDNNPFYESNQDLIDEENDSSKQEIQEKSIVQEADGFTTFYVAKPKHKCPRRKTFVSEHIFNIANGRMEVPPKGANKNDIFVSVRNEQSNRELCPHCGNILGKLNYLHVGSSQMGRTLATLLLDHAEPSITKDADVLYEGRKYITFTDNRQGSAKSAMGTNQDVERAWIRSSIFHKLADKRLDGIISGGLSPEEEELYNEYLKIKPLPPIFKAELDKLEAKKNKGWIVPTPEETSWNTISHVLENNSSLKRLFKHINEARRKQKIDNLTSYLKALMVDQFGWIPKRSNSLETLGLVRLTYPDLKKAKCPGPLLRKGLSNEDWQSFLKICIDYLIRGGKHYMISGEFNDYLTNNRVTTCIYPKDSELRIKGNAVSKWPSVRVGIGNKVNEEQSRLVLLLCAVLGYHDVEEIDDARIAEINGLLLHAWNFLTENILDLVDTENRGYKLDLLGSKVRLQLVEKGYLCPVDTVVVDTSFCGYSPRMNGYIGKSNFDRFKISTSFEYPYFPFKTGNINGTDLEKWIHENLETQIKSGVYSDITKRIYAQKPIFLSAEHSAQQSREDLDKYEAAFNAGHLNILSCSTTMEMGVDIGGISEVVMNNVPPKSANYLQRAGRAGRRNESKALALTFCAPNPIGSHTWNHPEYPITHLTETPLIRLESRQLIQRHVNALIFSYFVSKQNGKIGVTSRLIDFFNKTNGLSFFDKFLNYIDLLISGQDEEVLDSYRHLTKGSCIDLISLSEIGHSTKRDVTSIFNIYSTHTESFDKSIENAKGNGHNSFAIKAIERQKDNYQKKSLLSYLAENSFLPSAGIPTGLVECMLDLKNETNNPTLHLSQAITAYAPGKKVVKNEWIYEPAGIRLKTKYDDNTTRYVLQKCSQCGYATIRFGAIHTSCPKCGAHNSMNGLKNVHTSLTDSRFTEVVEPVAFSTSWNDQPHRNMNHRDSLNFVQPVLLEMEPWEGKTSSAKITLRCSCTNSEILFYNKGRNGAGFAFCPYCGRMENESSITNSKSILSGHKHLYTGEPCPGGISNGAYIRHHVVLVGRYQTDFVEIKFYDKDNDQIIDPDTLYSLGVILSRKLTELLGVNDGEIDFGYDPSNNSVFIYDMALGGAGYSILLREYLYEVLNLAYNALKKCDCECACTKCLIDRRSQWYLNNLNRKKALEWLELELKSRTAPEEITKLLPTASSVTSDFMTEIYQLLRNKDIKSIKFFMDSNLSEWRADRFPYWHIIRELKFADVEISFLFKGNIDFSSLSSALRATLLPTLIEFRFGYYSHGIPDKLTPLCSVIYNDGTVRTYFGNENSINTMSEKWGYGEVYSFLEEFSVSITNINTTSLLEELSNNNESMFDIRIRKNCSLHSFFDCIIQEKKNEWSRIMKLFSRKDVTICYSDRYLKTPLGILLLANLISSIQMEFQIRVKEVKIIVSKIRQDSLLESETIIVDKDFNNNKSRNSFLENAFQNIGGINPEIYDEGYIEHERCLTILGEEEELCIRPDAGISNGWKPRGYANAAISNEDFEQNWVMDLDLYNQKGNHSGILYTICYKNLKTRK